MKALVLKKPGEASVETVPNPVAAPGELLLSVRMVGFCGSDLNSFRGRNPLVTFPRIPGHEVSATVIEGDSLLPAGTDVALSPYTSCGSCASCRRGRSNACKFNQTLGVQRDGALAEFVAKNRPEDLPRNVVHEGKRALLNWLGCAIGASHHDTVSRAMLANSVTV